MINLVQGGLDRSHTGEIAEPAISLYLGAFAANEVKEIQCADHGEPGLRFLLCH